MEQGPIGSFLHGISIKDLFTIFLQRIPLADFIRLSLTCSPLRQRIFLNGDFWKSELMKRYPQPDGVWNTIEFGELEALHLLLDIEGRDRFIAHVYNISMDDYIRYAYMRTRLNAPVSSQKHLRFYVRLDTIGMPPIILIGTMQKPPPLEPEEKKVRKRVYMYERDADGKLLIGKLKDDKLKLKRSDDTFFGADRRTNNNGLIDYEESTETEQKKKKIVRGRLPYETYPTFVFERTDGQPIPEWCLNNGHTYYGRVSSYIIYAVDRMRPTVVKHIPGLSVRHGKSVSDEKFLVSLKSPEHTALFDVAKEIKPFLQIYSSYIMETQTNKLFDMYCPKK